jgi:hypothetical protein
MRNNDGFGVLFYLGLLPINRRSFYIAASFRQQIKKI